MDEFPEFIDDPLPARGRVPAGLGASRRVALDIAGRLATVEVHWPGPEGGFGPGALSGLLLAAPDARRQVPVCLVPMQDERVRGSLHGEVFVTQDSPEQHHFLLWVAVPAWRSADDLARLILAAVVRHEELARALKGPWPATRPEPRVLATAALLGAHVIQRIARQGPAGAEGWRVGEAWPRGVNLQEVVACARDGKPVEIR